MVPLTSAFDTLGNVFMNGDMSTVNAEEAKVVFALRRFLAKLTAIVAFRCRKP